MNRRLKSPAYPRLDIPWDDSSFDDSPSSSSQYTAERPRCLHFTKDGSKIFPRNFSRDSRFPEESRPNGTSTLQSEPGPSRSVDFQPSTTPNNDDEVVDDETDINTLREYTKLWKKNKDLEERIKEVKKRTERYLKAVDYYAEKKQRKKMEIKALMKKIASTKEQLRISELKKETQKETDVPSTSSYHDFPYFDDTDDEYTDEYYADNEDSDWSITDYDDKE